MSTEQVKANGNKGKKETATDDDDLIFITTNPLQYKPEKCGERPVRGKIISFEKMPYAEDPITKKMDKAWYVFNIELTRETIGVDAAGEVKTANVGDMIRVPMNVGLKDLFTQFRAATERKKLMEVKIQPLEKRKLDGLREMWDFKVGMVAPEKWTERPQGLPAFLDSSNNDLTQFFEPQQSYAAIPVRAGDVPF